MIGILCSTAMIWTGPCGPHADDLQVGPFLPIACETCYALRVVAFGRMVLIEFMQRMVALGLVIWCIYPARLTSPSVTNCGTASRKIIMAPYGSRP